MPETVQRLAALIFLSLPMQFAAIPRAAENEPFVVPPLGGGIVEKTASGRNYERIPFARATYILAMYSTALAAEPAIVRVERPDTKSANNFYPGNRPPLLPSPLIRLPAGSIKPRGWLRKQLELEADGFVGHLAEISPYCNHKENAWLSPEGVGRNGWEEAAYWLRGLADLGYALDDPRIIKETQLWIDGLLASQREDGWFGPRSNLGDGTKAPDLMPNMSMLSALRSYYEYTGDKRVLILMSKYFRWELAVPDKKFFSGGWQVPRSSDNLLIVHWYYNQTGDKAALELGEKLARCGSSWLGKVTGGHNVDFSQGFRKPAQVYQQNRDPKYLKATEDNWNSMMELYGQVPGGMFCGDEFARPGYTDPCQAIETCGVVEMMKSDMILVAITGDSKWVDRCEDAAYNTLPATTTADMKALRYLTSPNQCSSDARSKDPQLADGGPMQLMNPYMHRCCQHNMGMGWPIFAESQWMATAGNGLAAICYCACEVKAKVGDGTEVKITVEGHYPFDGRVDMKFATAKAVQFPLYLRIPAWCSRPSVSVNGQPVEISDTPGTYLKVNRTWSDGDTLQLNLPMALAVKTWVKNKNSVSVNYGPLTFSVNIGEKYKKVKTASESWPAWEILPSTSWNFGLVFDDAIVERAMELVTHPWPADNMPFTVAGSPLELHVRAKKIPNWQEDFRGIIDRLQPSPVNSTEPEETVSMLPMGACRIRVAALPTIAVDGGHDWAPPAEQMASYERDAGKDPISAINDGRVPTSSCDPNTPRFTWLAWAARENGKLQWVRQNVDKSKPVSSCEVYWFDEAPRGGPCRVPKSWRLLYRDGKDWKEVTHASGYGTEVDKFNAVTFDPIRTDAMRLEVQLQPKRNGGIYEWRIK
jgi:hypothetical protein